MPPSSGKGGGETMRAFPIAVTIVLGVVLLGLLVFPAGVRAHEQETSVDWEVAYANIRVSSAPIYAHYATQTLPLTGSGTPTTAVMGTQGYPTISLNTGEFLVVTWTFNYVATNAVRGDLFWITRLGLDFATIGRYVTCTLPAPEPATADCTGTNTWIGSSSFLLVPGARYDATLVLRSIQPTFRHLHVGVSVQNVGNIPAAPGPAGVTGNPPIPVLYGAFTDANGPVVEPLQGLTIGRSPFQGTFLLLTPWPWAVGGFVAQVLMGLVFIGIMFWYGRWEQRKGART